MRSRFAILVLVLSASGFSREAKASYAAETFSLSFLTGITSVGMDLGSRWEWGGVLGFKLDPEWSVGLLGLTSTKDIAHYDIRVSHLGVEGTWHAHLRMKKFRGFFAGPWLVFSTISTQLGSRVGASTDPGVGGHVGYDFMINRSAIWSVGPDFGWIHVFAAGVSYETFHFLLSTRIFL